MCHCSPYFQKISVLLKKYVPGGLRLIGISRPVLCLQVNLSLSSISASKHNFIITQLISVFLNLPLDWGSIILCNCRGHSQSERWKDRLIGLNVRKEFLTISVLQEWHELSCKIVSCWLRYAVCSSARKKIVSSSSEYLLSTCFQTPES